MISNKTNFRDIDNPFANYSLTLMSLKKEKHEAWKTKQAEKSVRLKSKIADMERKLDTYRKYKNEMGVQLTRKERDLVFNEFDSSEVSVLMSQKKEE